MNVSAASLAPDSSVRKATPSDITERTARSGAVVETIFCQDHGVRSIIITQHVMFLTELQILICLGHAGHMLMGSFIVLV